MSLNDCIGKTLKPWPILVDHYSLMNEHSSMQNGKVVRDRLRDTALKQYFTGGPIPFGYHSVTVSGVTSKCRRKLQILEEEAELVIEIFNLSEKGVNGKPLGVKSIAEMLNKRKSYRRVLL